MRKSESVILTTYNSLILLLSLLFTYFTLSLPVPENYRSNFFFNILIFYLSK